LIERASSNWRQRIRKPRKLADTASRYDSMACNYDRWYQSPVNARIDELEKRVMASALPDGYEGKWLLDVGCGTGHWFPLYVSKGYRIVGIDVSSGMLIAARDKFRGQFGLVRGDAVRLPFRDGSFDLVCAVATLHLVPDPSHVLAEMYRCLKPGGRLVIGALNALSYLGLKRAIQRSETFGGTRFLTVWELKRRLRPYGLPQLVTCAFLPPLRLLLPFAGWIEQIGKRLMPATGQFIVAWLDKTGDRIA
jgi:ubiquinone/menaquinone biosynthesis C-methylase UbiE